LLDLALCSFAIDPHPFQDADNQWYLFYAKDFLDRTDNARAGTGLAVAKMRGMTCLEPKETVILRARSDWQRFQSPRLMYGGIWDWHTLEGPCIHKHHDQYYCFYSGGRWETENYGVDYGIADNVLGPYSDAGNELGPRVLRTIPGRLIGPGHNSIIRGPDERTDYVVFHAWNQQMTRRVMHIAPLVWTQAGPRIDSLEAFTKLS
jgi:GH43 family beta-xylosidase